MISVSEDSSLVVGLKQVKRSISEKKAKEVFIAKDCDQIIKSSVEKLCADCGIAPKYAETMSELGAECGIDVKASCACVC